MHLRRITAISAGSSALWMACLSVSSPAATLFSDNFSGTSNPPANPPYTTTTSNGGTISENNQLNVGLAPNNPESAYVSTSDNVSAQHYTGYNGTFGVSADVNLSGLEFARDPNNTQFEGINLISLLPYQSAGTPILNVQLAMTTMQTPIISRLAGAFNTAAAERVTIFLSHQAKPTA
jgi:hypothetical protein